MGIVAGALNQGTLQTVLISASVGLLVLMTIGLIVALMFLAKRLAVAEQPQALRNGGGV
jgi:hypothetical protein